MDTVQADIDAVAKIAIVPSLLEVICRTTGMGFAAVARVTDSKWIACSVRDEIAFGLVPGGELPLETTICNEIRQHGNEVVIDHVATDACYATHHTPAQYGFQSYISIPITRKDGRFFGTLCAIDPKPNQLNNQQVLGMFRAFADLIAFHLQAVDELADSKASLVEEKKIAELREQFVAILGHDLRNPIGAISNSAELLQLMTTEEDILRLVEVIKNSSFRVQGLIENLLDFARTRLGAGIDVSRKPISGLASVLQVVVTELRTIWPDRIINTHFTIDAVVHCDRVRIAQLFSNLLGNALTHGNAADPVTVNASTQDGKFSLTVSNTGKPIPAAQMPKLFTAFYRTEVKPGQQGLGLGLYISAEIARAHGGSISVESTSEATCFRLEIPA